MCLNPLTTSGDSSVTGKLMQLIARGLVQLEEAILHRAECKRGKTQWKNVPRRWSLHAWRAQV